jgi:mRNA-degrading endonuclease RelE of RelBE toxin-antitoxin system
VRYEFKPSFDRSIKALHPKQKADTRAACFAFLDLIETQAHLPVGIGLKRLQDGFWEIRHGIHYRILFRWRQDLIEFILAGDHDSIKDFLKDY